MVCKSCSIQSFSKIRPAKVLLYSEDSPEGLPTLSNLHPSIWLVLIHILNPLCHFDYILTILTEIFLSNTNFLPGSSEVSSNYRTHRQSRYNTDLGLLLFDSSGKIQFVLLATNDSHNRQKSCFYIAQVIPLYGVLSKFRSLILNIQSFDKACFLLLIQIPNIPYLIFSLLSAGQIHSFHPRNQ